MFVRRNRSLVNTIKYYKKKNNWPRLSICLPFVQMGFLQFFEFLNKSELKVHRKLVAIGMGKSLKNVFSFFPFFLGKFQGSTTPLIPDVLNK